MDYEIPIHHAEMRLEDTNCVEMSFRTVSLVAAYKKRNLAVGLTVGSTQSILFGIHACPCSVRPQIACAILAGSKQGLGLFEKLYAF